jgi:putative transposase
MTQGLHRYQQAGDLHFLTFSCYHRLPYFNHLGSRSLFESALERIRRRNQFVVIGYVVMPEHVHLLVSEPKLGTLALGIQALKLSVSVRERQRPFWQARYYDFNVFSAAKHTEKLRYMHRNPVVRGLVSKPEDWPWSSFRHYATGHEGTVEIESFWTASRRERGYIPPRSQKRDPSTWLRAGSGAPKHPAERETAGCVYQATNRDGRTGRLPSGK